MINKNIFLFTMLLITFNSFAQDKMDTQTVKVWRINFLNPAIELEYPISNKSTISSAIGIGYNGAYPDLTYGGDGFIYIIAPFLDVQYKYFYNFKKRQNKNRTIKNNSGNFISLRLISHGPSIMENINRTSDFDFAFGPTWGIQRKYGKNFHFLFDVGPQYYFDTYGNGNIMPIMVQINLGFDLNK